MRPVDSPANTAQSVLALNAGSSSIKFGLFALAPRLEPLRRGALTADGGPVLEQISARVADLLARHPLGAVVHRIVHGGTHFHEPRIVDDQVLVTLRELMHLAPNHLPDELRLIEQVRHARPSLLQAVCFDTAFHRTLPDVARRLPLPTEYHDHGVQRYGFHGLSYTFLMDALAQRNSGSAPPRVVLAHLGNGSSLAAVLDGRSIDTSMGFTPIGGVMMGTRAGDIDPGALTYLARLKGFDAETLERELTHRSGLAGVSNGRSDMRELLAREDTDPHCRLAVAMYCYQIAKCVGAYAAALHGLDALVFSGGIGQHAPAVRRRVCAGLGFLGIDLDDRANGTSAPVISRSHSRVAVHVIPTDEEVVMARAAAQLLDRGR